jgi:hypothetical protein
VPEPDFDGVRDLPVERPTMKCAACGRGFQATDVLCSWSPRPTKRCPLSPRSKRELIAVFDPLHVRLYRRFGFDIVDERTVLGQPNWFRRRAALAASSELSRTW